MNNDKSEHPFSKNKGFKVLGVGKQELIKYFFGGNAFISIVVLLLITIFLAREAIYFFPQSNTNLKIYRQAGLEFTDYTDDQLKYQQRLKSLATNVKQYELFHRAGFGEYVPKVFSEMKNQASEKMKPEILSFKISADRISSKEIIWSIWSKGKNEEKKALAAKQQKEFTDQFNNAKRILAKRINTVAYEISINKLKPEIKQIAYKIDNTDPSVFPKLQQALVEFYSNYTGKEFTPEFVKSSSDEGIRRKNEIAKDDIFTNLSDIEKTLTVSYLDFNKMVNELRERVSVIKDRAVSYFISKEKEIALKEGIPLASPERKAELEVQLARIISKEPDYGNLAIETTAYLPQHKQLHDTMVASTISALSKLPSPEDLENPEAQIKLKTLITLSENYPEFMQSQRAKLENWKYDKPITTLDSLGSFFFGSKWVANSSWNNFFGLKPLFGGSLFITLIAVTIATPFAVGGAIYVNRLASPLEQNIIKPIIEFIQAIPSVVIAFLGVLVVGQKILSLSYSDMLNWIPGFPAQGEQMMLTAGILLAFMAVPTMFTLAEDAINNVPKSYREASLALGATKLQTVLKVILPCSLSGVVAAVLLGFGRIIGETMVVLLVAGGRIKWPDTWTDPVHTMTGIIAQSTGEAAAGSIQYRALFLVGLMLFLISLILNSLAQNVIKRYGAKS